MYMLFSEIIALLVYSPSYFIPVSINSFLGIFLDNASKKKINKMLDKLKNLNLSYVRTIKLIINLYRHVRITIINLLNKSLA